MNLGATHPLFTAMADLFLEINSSRNPRIDIDNELQTVIAGLAEKTISHCTAVWQLTPNGFLSEALILLRPTYEGAVTMHHLLSHREDIALYKAHSTLCEYKDLLISLDLMTDEKKLTFANDKQAARADIIERGLLQQTELFNLERDEVENGLPESILDKTNKLRKKLKNNIRPLPTMLNEINDTRVKELLGDLNLRVYNYGSQLIHGYWHTVRDYHLLSGPPDINVFQIGLYVMVLLDCSVRALEPVGLLTKSVEGLQVEFTRVRDELTKIRPHEEE